MALGVTAAVLAGMAMGAGAIDQSKAAVEAAIGAVDSVLVDQLDMPLGLAEERHAIEAGPQEPQPSSEYDYGFVLARWADPVPPGAPVQTPKEAAGQEPGLFEDDAPVAEAIAEAQPQEQETAGIDELATDDEQVLAAAEEEAAPDLDQEAAEDDSFELVEDGEGIRLAEFLAGQDAAAEFEFAFGLELRPAPDAQNDAGEELDFEELIF